MNKIMSDFKQIYNDVMEESDDCHTDLHQSILDHSAIRSHCYEVVRRIIQLDKTNESVGNGIVINDTKIRDS